jgi:hypothetical protein
VEVHRREPFLCVRDHWLEYDGIAFSSNAHAIPRKTKFLWQPHCLAVAVAEQSGCFRHGWSALQLREQE